MCSKGENITLEKVIKVIRSIVEALEKQILKKPKWIIVNLDYGAGYYGCPCCQHHVKESDDFCSKCGQHLDWGE